MAGAKRKRILDHFAVIHKEHGQAPKIWERWPLQNEDCAYDLPPALPHFVCETAVVSSATTGTKTYGTVSSGRRRFLFSLGGSNKEGGERATLCAHPDPSTHFYPFVLTGSEGEHIYGATLIRRLPNPPVDGEQSSGNDIEALCFLSRFPVFSLLHDILFQLHLISKPEGSQLGDRSFMLPPNHNLSLHHHQDGFGQITSPAKKNSQRRRSTSAGDGYAVHSSAALAAADAADAIARAAANASHAGTISDVHLQVTLSAAHGAHLGFDYKNYNVSWAKQGADPSRLFIIEVRGQAAAAGVSVGDELLELNGEPIRPGTHRFELQQKLREAADMNGGRILILVRCEATAAARLRLLAAAEDEIGARKTGILVTGASARGSNSNPSGNSGHLKSQPKQQEQQQQQQHLFPQQRTVYHHLLPRVSPYSMERLVPHVMDRLRLPPAGGLVDIVMGPGQRCVSWNRSFAGSAMPKIEDASYSVLWRLLSVPSVISIVEALVLERRVLVVADNVAVLAPVCEALVSFLFPFVWPHVYIPLLPEELVMYLEAPVPFFIGISSTFTSLDVVAELIGRNSSHVLSSGSMPNAGGDVSSSSPGMFHGGVAVSGANTASNGGMVDSDAIIVFLDTDRVTTCPRQTSPTPFQKHESTTSSEQRPQTSPQQDEQPQPQQSNAQVSKSSTPMSSSKGNKGKFNSNSNGIFSPASAGSVEQRNTTSSSQSSGTLEYTHEEKIPQHLREHLIQSLSLLRDSLRKPTRNLPFYGYCGEQPSMAAVIAAAAERVRRGRRLRQAVERQRKQRKEMRHRAAVAAKKAANLASALSPRAASPHLDTISDNSKGNRAQGDSGTPNSGGSAASLTAAATPVNHGHGAAPLPLSGPEMDFDAPRFCFIHLWAELLLTYSEFLQPDDREARKKQKRRRRERRRKHRRQQETHQQKTSNGRLVGTNESSSGSSFAGDDSSSSEDLDDKIVHGFDSNGFLEGSPPHWRPFLRRLLVTNIFQQFNHEACEAAINRSRNAKRPAVFFERFTQSQTLSAARMMVENSLAALDEESIPTFSAGGSTSANGNMMMSSASGIDSGSDNSAGGGAGGGRGGGSGVVGSGGGGIGTVTASAEWYRQAYDRIAPPPYANNRSDVTQEEEQYRREALWQNGSLKRWQRKRQIFYSYTAFPDLSRDWGAGTVLSHATTTNSAGRILVCTGDGAPSAPPSGEHDMNVDESAKLKGKKIVAKNGGGDDDDDGAAVAHDEEAGSVSSAQSREGASSAMEIPQGIAQGMAAVAATYVISLRNTEADKESDERISPTPVDPEIDKKASGSLRWAEKGVAESRGNVWLAEHKEKLKKIMQGDSYFAWLQTSAAVMSSSSPAVTHDSLAHAGAVTQNSGGAPLPSPVRKRLGSRDIGSDDDDPSDDEQGTLDHDPCGDERGNSKEKVRESSQSTTDLCENNGEKKGGEDNNSSDAITMRAWQAKQREEITMPISDEDGNEGDRPSSTWRDLFRSEQSTDDANEDEAGNNSILRSLHSRFGGTDPPGVGRVAKALSEKQKFSDDEGSSGDSDHAETSRVGNREESSGTVPLQGSTKKAPYVPTESTSQAAESTSSFWGVVESALFGK